MDEIIGSLHEFYVLNIVKIGYLSKKGHIRASIKERYFILKYDVMEYYKENMREKRGIVAYPHKEIITIMLIHLTLFDACLSETLTLNVSFLFNMQTYTNS